MSTTDQSSGQENSARTEVSSVTQSPVEKKEETSKYTIRKQIWTNFEKNGLVTFPKPVRGRIPNFHEAPTAAAKLAELDIFKNATHVKVNADKPQENVRILTLENGKTLLVNAPRGKECLLMKVVASGSANVDLKKAASRKGMLDLGQPVELGTDIKIDLVVLGSVVVSRQGHRIGKGKGFEDLEFAVLVEAGVITNDTVVATTVHDSQVFETLPEELFKDYDIPVDVIVTPNEVIHIANKLPKPAGIFWNILSERKMKLLAVLKALRDKEISNGKECHLKEDTDSETERTRRHLRRVRCFVRYSKKRRPEKTEGEKTGVVVATEQTDKVKEKKKQTRRLHRRFITTAVEGNDVKGETDLRKQKKLYQKRRRFSRSLPIQFSIRIGNINSKVRVRDLKNALAERNVKPTVIIWRGYKGFAFIHFAKPKTEPETPNQADNIVESLRDMKIGNGEEVTLLVEYTKPVIRIETTGVTAI